MFRRHLSTKPVQLGTALQQQFRFGSGKDKVVSSEDAVHLIESGSTVTVGGFVSQGAPEEVLKGLEARFLETGHPSNLTLLFGGGPGDWDSKGLNHLAHPGMVRRTIGAHYGQVPKLAALAQDNKIEAYNLPLGSISRMIRCAGSGQPGHLTTVGFGTAVDPALGGGKINEVTTDDLVIPVDIEGKKYLLYKALQVDCAIVRGTTADADGNITMERESLYADHMIQALSARASRGVVIAQVERLASKGSLHPRHVQIPGTMVDAVVVATDAVNHYMSYVTPYNPGATAEVRLPPKIPSKPLDIRKIIARRAALELSTSEVINLGIGMPEGIAEVCNEERVLSKIELTTEPGVHGGVGLSGHDFGPAVNYDCLFQMNQQFDFYNGGGLDAAFLGMAEVDPSGNVNVTRVGPKLTGPGGFIDISQSTHRVTLMGTFTAGGLKIEVTEDKKLKIVQEGKSRKFVKSVKEITFSGQTAINNKQVIHYVTERCVFTLTKDGLELIEVAPGIDVQTQILDLMDFKPKVAKKLRTMHPAIFSKGLMELKKLNFEVHWNDRFTYDAAKNTCYINLSNCSITRKQQVDDLVTSLLNFVASKTTEKKFHGVVNYDNFDCSDDVTEYYATTIDKMNKDHYLTVRRYTTRAFNRHKLQERAKISDDREYTLEDVKQFLLDHGIAANPHRVETLFARADAEDGTEDGKCTAAGFEKLVDRLCRHVKGAEKEFDKAAETPKKSQ